MKHFLELVAQDIYKKYGNHLEDIVVVFPNKRGRLFFNEYLANLSSKPIWSPIYLSISEFVESQSSMQVADKILLIVKLYETYKQVFPETTETIDEFYGWGEVLLSDFDDIDKNLVDANQLFKNIEYLHELDNDDYLTDNQRDALKHFFHLLTDNETELKHRFSALWQNLHSIYKQFKSNLRAENLAYEGALYRDVVEHELTLEHTHYIFIGFNLLQKSEQRIFQVIKDAGKAKFYWDIDSYYMQNSPAGIIHEAGAYIQGYMDIFPNELDSKDETVYNNLIQKKNITYIAANTETAQARYVGQWLQEQERIEAGTNTAIVLCNEDILPSVLHSLPPTLRNVNITAGLNLSTLPIFSFLTTLFDIRMGISSGKRKYIPRRLVEQLCYHPMSKYVSDEFEVVRTYIEEHFYPFIQMEQATTDETILSIFSPFSGEQSKAKQFADWIMHILESIGRNTAESDDVLLKESVFKCFTVFQRLSTLIHEQQFDINLATLFKLSRQIMSRVKIPFHGEPAIGVQIMGLFETRGLDFDHLLVLSCNEGNIPRQHTSTSIIPYSLRKAFGLSTNEHIDSLYSYYFHRLLQRTSDATFTYNQATSGTHKAEMSRYMLQLLVESPLQIERKAIMAKQAIIRRQPTPIQKTPRCMKPLYEKASISPSAIGRYLRCPLSFYYQYCLGLSDNQKSSDPTDNRLFGNLFHEAACNLHEQVLQMASGREPTPSQYAELLKKTDIEQALDLAFEHNQLLSPTNQTVKHDGGLNLISRRVLTSYLKKLLDIDTHRAPARILQAEYKIGTHISVPLASGDFSLRIGGTIDRIDTPQQLPNTLRVVDYKTGSPELKTNLTLDDIFSHKGIDHHGEYFIQAFIYSIILAHDKTINPQSLPVSPSLMFIRRFDPENPLYTLLLENRPITNIGEIEADFIRRLKTLLSEIYSPEGAFCPTDDKKRCQTCPFVRLCHS